MNKKKNKIVELPKRENKLELEPEELCMCPRCEILNEYTEMLFGAENSEQIRDILDEMFDEVFNMGYVSFIKDDIENKLEYLKTIGEIEVEGDGKDLN